MARLKGIKTDWIIPAVYASLLLIGWVAQYSATNIYNDQLDFLDFQVPIVKQTVYIFFALVLFFIGLSVDGKFWHTFAYLFYGISLFLLILVLFIGSEVKGAKAWFNFGGFSFQPSEFSKLSTALALSSYLSYFKVKLTEIKYQSYALLIIFTPCLLILIQPDAGSLITFFSLFLLLFLEGLNAIYLIAAILLIAIFVGTVLFPIEWILFSILLLSFGFSWYYLRLYRYHYLLAILLMGIGVYLTYQFGVSQGIWFLLIALTFSLVLLWRAKQEKLAIMLPMFAIGLVGFGFGSNSIYNGLKPHQQERIKVWLKPSECDPRGSLYNLLQSKVAIGSGGVFGKGFLNGNMTKLKYVPEQSTDFIFSTIGEEHGFIGSAAVMILFLVLIWRIFAHSVQMEYKFGSCFGMALAGFLGFHVIINIGMTMGLVPIIGIPLPFISKGGSSLMVFSLMLGIFLKFQSKGK
ncbi:MAG: rod shape-determining protein RodA [Saprospiraceae bacterium]|nr:rod shape-determining protein RodA [Saprospiraceae bacterium]